MFVLEFVTVRKQQLALVYYRISDLTLLPLLSVNNYMQNEVFLGSLHIVTWPVHLEVLVNFLRTVSDIRSLVLPSLVRNKSNT